MKEKPRRRKATGSAGTDTTSEHDCLSCRQRRQLQIYFTGYEQKEEKTHQLMEELLRTMAPEIGCVLTVGFSGLWDRALVNFIGTVSKRIQRENKATHPDSTACICIDKDTMPPLLHELEIQGIETCHVRALAEEFAQTFAADAIPQTLPLPKAIERFAVAGSVMDDGLWKREFDGQRLADALPSSYEFFRGKDYLKNFSHLRQLGVKTKISIAIEAPAADRLVKEQDHNRRQHSIGASHLAALWFEKLSDSQHSGLNPQLRERLRALTVVAAMHHDLGHLPFTHLAEEA